MVCFTINVPHHEVAAAQRLVADLSAGQAAFEPAGEDYLIIASREL
jgi:hypothetical protein